MSWCMRPVLLSFVSWLLRYHHPEDDHYNQVTTPRDRELCALSGHSWSGNNNNYYHNYYNFLPNVNNGTCKDRLISAGYRYSHMKEINKTIKAIFVLLILLVLKSPKNRSSFYKKTLQNKTKHTHTHPPWCQIA